MANTRYSRVLIAIIIAGLVAALFINYQRYLTEKNTYNVEMVMDYEDITELAQTEGYDAAALLDMYKDAGITSLAIYERTLEKLNKSGKMTSVSGADILHGYRAGTLNDPYWIDLIAQNKVMGDKVYVMGQNNDVFLEVKEDLILRLGKERVKQLRTGDRPVLEVKANYEKVLKWNLGLPTDEMRDAAAHGFYVVARPSNYTKVDEQDIKAVFKRINSVDNVSTIMFVGQETLGWPNLLMMTADLMKDKKLTLGLIEHPLQLQFVKQEGLTELAALNQYRAARVYVIPKDEQPKLKLDEAVHRWAITDEERNIRINFLRNFDKPAPGKQLIETNLEYVAKVKEQVEQRGFTIGKAAYFGVYFPNPWLLAVIIAGATAAGVLYLSLLVPIKPRWQYMLTAILSMLLIIPVVKGGGTTVRQATALVSAVVFPVLSMSYLLDRWKIADFNGKSFINMIVYAVYSLTFAVCLSLIGGLYVGAVLSDVRFFLEMDIFRGVKLTFVAPLILITLIYLTRFNLFESNDSRGLWQQVKKMLDYPVYIKTLIAFAAAAVVGLIFVGRSGHTAGVPVPAIELKMRAFLEKVMYARPREKEFMIGHPAFFLAVMALNNNWPRILHFILVVAATIGQGSLVETFAHMRTPVIMSVVRAADGLILGIPFGILAIVGVQVLVSLTHLLGRRSAE